MSTPDQADPGDPRWRPTPTRIAVAVLLLIGIIVPLLVSTYASAEPRLFGFPFFYWYQLLWVFLSAILVSISYRLVRAEERKRRAAQGLGDPEKDGDQ